MHSVRVKRSAQVELQSVPETEQLELRDLLESFETCPFPDGFIRLTPPDAFQIRRGCFDVSYLVIADDVIVCAITSNSA